MDKKLFITLLSTAVLSLASCKKEEPAPTPSEEKKELVNPNPAQNNADIIAQHLSDRVQNFYDTQTYNGEIYTLGNIDGKTNVMKINPLGDVIWTQRVPLASVQDIAVNANGVFVVGNYDSNSDQKNDRARVIVYNLQGTYLTEYTFSVTNYEHTILNDIATNGNEVIVGGFVEKQGVQYPYWPKVTFEGGEISKVKEQVFTQFPKQRISNVHYHDNYLYYTTNEYISVSDEIHKANITKVKYDTQEVVWTTPIVADNPQHKLSFYIGSGIVVNGKDIYLAGMVDDGDKPLGSDNGFWDSGLVVKVVDNAISASIAWKKKVAVSNKSENFNHLTFHNNTLYVVGKHSYLMYTKQKKHFGNGFLVKLDTNGNILSTKSFGEKEKENIFYAGVVLNGQFVAFGKISDSDRTNYKAWIVKTAL